MKTCPACARHLKLSATTCPFCQASLGATSPTLAALSLAAGLALAGCSADDGESTTGESTGASSSTTSSTASSTSSTTAETTTTTSSTSTSSTTDMSGPVSAYGGPPVDTITDGKTVLPPPDADAPVSPADAARERR